MWSHTDKRTALELFRSDRESILIKQEIKVSLYAISKHDLRKQHFRTKKIVLIAEYGVNNITSHK